MKTTVLSLITAALATFALTMTAAPPLATAQPEAEAAVAARIDLQGAVNARDIGGYRTYDGARTKSGKAIRSDSLEKLTEADVQKLAGLNVKTVIDMRTPGEVQFAGADKPIPGAQAVARPVDDTGLFQRMLAVIQTRDPQKQEEALGNGKAEQIMLNMYTTFISSQQSRAAFGQTIKDVANTDKVTLYHCTAGKDRTGWLTYVLLRAVGVPEGTARQDYLLSNQYRAAADAALRQQVKQAGYMQNPDLLIPLQEVRNEYLDAAIQKMEQDYGDFGKYLTQGLGLDGGSILKLRRNLVT
ncbi:tyrosine-protein phosphatase [Nocardia iowensis]|uniref:Tyrosine-protein phosphatase n=1 Tax=Nocardia iowensis TaxID=204891 RepID=A0ABX8RVD8_NOCIO|nr:tyrosine-protein phosphatase [Nocardia iowensis]QXN93595.1 tyrosine-protein phosphatase [Nocardia iowensis]